MPDTHDSLDSILRTASGRKASTKPEPDAEEDTEALRIADMNGHSMRPSNKPLTRMHVVHKDGRVETLQYHHIEAKSEYNGTSFVFLFSGAKLWELTVEGRNLWRLYDYISLCRWPYIRVATRDFEGMDDKGEVVTAVRVKDVTPRSEE